MDRIATLQPTALSARFALLRCPATTGILASITRLATIRTRPLDCLREVVRGFRGGARWKLLGRDGEMVGKEMVNARIA